ncbi:ABC transporter substrate-binding protein [Cellulosimicrobium cellulans]|uniref:ABC transporter substrate-binding protein n=1 Tax=Cellulosimicrobium cellulans TaxID=1710 RepID=UPI002406F36B|nr:iron-siderophore ABC transporter substrate-binding protein [Cellulosimicrobium cellulans]MDF9877104.1 iron complex transport system substrate-binding protein [Cellulosimicrobium cellulans]
MPISRTPSSSPRVRRGALAGALVLASALLTACSSGPAEPVPTATVDATAAGYAVEHARGTAELAAAPQRVVTLEPVETDTAVALGVVPVGAAVLSVEAGVPAYLGEDAQAIEVVGTVPEPSLEAIAALEPDLILGTESRHADLYDQLAGIAPTVFMATQTDPWQENVLLVGRALGRETDAQALLDAYDERCAQLQEDYDVTGTAQLLRPRDGIVSAYGPRSFAGSTLECVGFSTPEQDWGEDISVDLSPERVTEAAADLVLVSAADPADPAAVPAEIPLNAGAFPDVRVVDQSYWISGVGPLGGQAVLDDVEQFLQDRAGS